MSGRRCWSGCGPACRVAATTKIESVFPTRGVPGGWRDVWDEPDDSVDLRATAEAWC